MAALAAVALAALAALPTALAGAALPGRHAGSADAATLVTADQASATQRVRITLDDIEPSYAQPGDTVTLSGVLTNISGSKLTDASVVLRASSQLVRTRYDLAKDADPDTVVGPYVTGTTQLLGSLQPGQAVTWHIAVTVGHLGLRNNPVDFGAYPLVVEARTSGNGGYLPTRMPTFITWVPADTDVAPTQVSWLWPLVDGTHRGEGTTFLDDRLATDLSPQGRLGELLTLAQHATVPLTYAVDPALVDDATVMADGVQPPAQAAVPKQSTTPKSTTPKSTSPVSAPPSSAAATPYQVDSGGQTRAGSGAQAAASWLTGLKSAVKSPQASVVPLAYADVDMVALDRSGLDREIDLARSTGEAVLADELGTPLDTGVVWPIGSVINQSTLDDLAGDSVETVVLSDQSLPPVDPNAVPGVRTDLQTASGSVKAVLADSTIGDIVTDPASVVGGVRAAEQRFLAETTLLTEQRPGTGSALVIAPPRDWNPPTAYAQQLLDDTATMPWLRGVSLATLAAQPADGIARTALVYPNAAKQAELPGNSLRDVAALRSDLGALSAVLGPTTTEPFFTTAAAAILRSESAELRARPSTGEAIRAQVRSDLTARTRQVSISTPRLITLASRKEKIPITVVNDLAEPVTVSIQLTAVNPARLKVTPSAPLQVAAHSRGDLLVEVRATTSGRFQVDAQLMTPETTPRPFGAKVSFELNSTAYGAVALAIAAAAAGLLVLLSGFRLIRRMRRANGDRGAGAAPTP